MEKIPATLFLSLPFSHSIYIRRMFFRDEWFSGGRKIEHLKLISFSPWINRKVIFKRIIELWFHELWINKGKIVNLLSINWTEQSLIFELFQANICLSSYRSGFGENCTLSLCLSPLSLLDAADVNISVAELGRWYRFCGNNLVDIPNIEYHWDGSWFLDIFQTTVYMHKSSHISANRASVLLLVESPTENYSFSGFSPADGRKYVQYLDAYKHT